MNSDHLFINDLMNQYLSQFIVMYVNTRVSISEFNATAYDSQSSLVRAQVICQLLNCNPYNTLLDNNLLGHLHILWV